MKQSELPSNCGEGSRSFKICAMQRNQTGSILPFDGRSTSPVFTSAGMQRVLILQERPIGAI